MPNVFCITVKSCDWTFVLVCRWCIEQYTNLVDRFPAGNVRREGARLYQHLFKDYNKNMAPMQDTKNKFILKVGLALKQIIAIHERTDVSLFCHTLLVTGHILISDKWQKKKRKTLSEFKGHCLGWGVHQHDCLICHVLLITFFMRQNQNFLLCNFHDLQVLETLVWLRQVWTDDRLTWKPADYGGIETLILPNSIFWKPDTTLMNSIGPHQGIIFNYFFNEIVFMV